MPHRVVITGLGLITSIGIDQASVIRSLRELRHGFQRYEFLDNPELPVKVIGSVPEFDTEGVDAQAWTFPSRYPVNRETLRSLSPHGLYAHCSMLQAIEDAGLREGEVSNEATGLYSASAGSPGVMHHYLSQMHRSGGRRNHPMGVVTTVSGTLHFNLCAFFHILGSACGFVSACSSSSHALLYAAEDIRHGRQERMFVTGGEELMAETVLPFNGMRALSTNPDPDRASRPFDVKRNGFVPTGGGVTMVLESEEAARARGARIYGELAGWAQASDGYHIAIPHPDGDGLRRTIELLFRQFDVAPAEVDYVNAHATSTLAGDLAEGRALDAVFGSRNCRPAISSTKALTGHGLSLAGVAEAAFCALLLREGFIPGSAHIEELDPAFANLDIVRESRDQAPATILSNSSGFGGGNVSLLLRRCPD